MRVGAVLLCTLSASMLLWPSTAWSALNERSPKVVCDYLIEAGLKTRGWKLRLEPEYGCSSPYRDIGPNNLAYYVKGTASAAEKVWLQLNVNDRSQKNLAHAELLSAAEMLIKKTLGIPIPVPIRQAIVAGKNAREKSGNTSIEVARSTWPTGPGYDIKVTLQ